MSNQVQIGQVFKGSESGKVVAAQGETVDLAEDGVVIKIIYGSFCGTDLHMLKNDMVLGHEPVGVVSQVGPKVQKIKVGDKVGFGYNSDACLQCRKCMAGQDTQCPERKMYGNKNKHQGAWGDTAIIRESFVHKIPEGISLEAAAPLQCGGVTCYAALVHAGVQPWHRVGVVGIGGLGHLAIQYANKFGCEVTVFSSTNSKKEEATKLGAHHFVATKETPDLSKLGLEPLDHLVVTTSHLPDWSQFLPILNDHATVIPLTVSKDDLAMPSGAVIGKELRMIGSLVGSRGIHHDMLQFTARHNIKPMTETLPMTEKDINEAVERLSTGKNAPRYRFVFENQNNKQYLK